ncbi:MAG: hotdog fold thioesterase [Actinobacteria bacterium]|nr:hotdog fold thioesterase [Actinomycetota bacterium]
MNDKKITDVIKKNIEEEPYAKLFGIKVLKLEEGHSKVTMKVKKDYNNIFGITHGGAVFSLLDVAFGSAANSYGTVAVALNINVNYLKPSLSGDLLTAEAKEVAKSNKISTFNIIVKNGSGEIVAVAQTIAYQKNEKLPFLK